MFSNLEEDSGVAEEHDDQREQEVDHGVDSAVYYLFDVVRNFWPALGRSRFIHWNKVCNTLRAQFYHGLDCWFDRTSYDYDMNIQEIFRNISNLLLNYCKSQGAACDHKQWWSLNSPLTCRVRHERQSSHCLMGYEKGPGKQNFRAIHQVTTLHFKILINHSSTVSSCFQGDLSSFPDKQEPSSL